MDNATAILPHVYNTTLNTTIAKSTLRPALSGNEYVGHEWKVITRVVYILIFLLGTVGNLLTCYIIISRKFMRRVIHIYTFNLAVSDLAVILLYIPVEMVRSENDMRWTMGASMCKVNYIVTPTSLIASVCTLVAITLDRHRGVTRPFQWRGDSKKLLKYSIPAIWLIAVACSCPLFHYANVVRGPRGFYCIETWTSNIQERVYWIVMFFVMVVIPLLVIIFANAHMIYVMKKLSNSTTHSDVAQHRQHRRMIRMVIALVFVYALCSSPQHIVFFWFQYGNLESQRHISMHVFKASNLMIIVQSAINPVIYGTGRRDFKSAFKNIFRCFKMREWITASRYDTRVGEMRSSVFSANNSPKAIRDDMSKQYVMPLECQRQPLVNKKAAKLQKKSTESSVTDTPPLIRLSSSSLKPNSKPYENGTDWITQSASHPVGPVREKKVSFRILKEENGNENQNVDEYSAEVHIDRNLLTLIKSLTESEV